MVVPVSLPYTLVSGTRLDRGVAQQDLDLEPDQSAKQEKSARDEVLVYCFPQPRRTALQALPLLVGHFWLQHLDDALTPDNAR